MLVCPVCGERSIGKIGIGQYYCKECCLEFVQKNDKLSIYNLQDDGTLSQYVIGQECNSAIKEIQKTS
ncbi:hypothetical protein [Anaerosinus massiliensis]|uniref:hypothetical protein n=1 Tax=Massilibacillus massiliensis TaxID=1806837 RepID=UPI000DA626D7|nr:hypothetical protein [Massilibacillus massiliensis]